MTTPLPDPASPTRRGPSLATRFAIAFLMGVLLVGTLGVGALYAYGQQYTGRVLPGVKVGQVDLSGLTASQAHDALGAAYAAFGAGTITLSGPNGDLTIGYGEVGRAPDLAAMVDTAMTTGRAGEAVADLIGAPQTALHGVTLTPSLTYDPVKLAAAVEAAAKTIDRPEVEATLVADKGEFFISESVEGRVVDQAALVRTLGQALAKLDAPTELRADIPFTNQPPVVTTAAVQAAKDTAERMTRDLVLTRGSKSWTITSAQLRALITFATATDGSIVPVVDEAGIAPLVKPIATALDRAATNATFRISGSRVVVGKSSREGLRVSKARTQQAILDALMARQAGEADAPLSPVVAPREPAVSTAAAKKIAPRMREISHWTTHFPIWSHNAFGANIWIPASVINGFVVGPGETFDFWKVVGEVNRAKGYGLGGAIVDGHTQAQGAIGGGICSCSTTLFNAALRGGFKMGARRNHYYYIDRYPLGLDATVFISAGGAKQTMTWTNDTKYPVLIRGINTRSGNRGFVTFRLYSVPTGRTISISAPTVKNIRRASDSTIHSAMLRTGYSGRLEYPTDGKDVWRTVTVRQGGKVIRRTTYFSHYSAVTGILVIGTGGPSAPTKLP